MSEQRRELFVGRAAARCAEIKSATSLARSGRSVSRCRDTSSVRRANWSCMWRVAASSVKP